MGNNNARTQFFNMEPSEEVIREDDLHDSNQPVEVIPLKSEGFVTPERLAIRENLVRRLRCAPESFLAYWQILALETGCRHACPLCAQETGPVVTSFTQTGLEDILSALLTLATERRTQNAGGTLVGYGFETYRPRIMKLSHDNDSGDSMLLEHAIRHMHENFGVLSRLSMVAYSRRNNSLQSMHDRIVRDLADGVDSIRFTFSSHTLGWRKRKTEYLQDFGNMLRTWKPFVEQRQGLGRYHGALTEFRMDPDIEVFEHDLDDEFIQGRHVLHLGSVLLISATSDRSRPMLNDVVGVQGRSAVFRFPLLDYYMFISDDLIRNGDWRDFAATMINRQPQIAPHCGNVEQMGGCCYAARRGGLARVTNCDGPFYVFEPAFRFDGQYAAMNLYPISQSRKVSGLFEETRWCLNGLLRYKAKVGIGRRERFPDATWSDVDSVIREIKTGAEDVMQYNERAAAYTLNHVIPLVAAYADVLKEAGYSPDYFFDPKFTYFAGPIYNLGRAVHLFKGIVSISDEPITSNELREYYLTYRFEPPTKLSPLPLLLDGEMPTKRITGSKYLRAASGDGSVVFEELNRVGMRPIRSLYLNGLVGLTRRKTDS